ncbi:MAG: sulfotransferase [Bacteroidetes bacterium]|nr:sulfotransferase [Bacteroidota bacterium]
MDEVIGSYNKSGGSFLLNENDATQSVISKMQKIYNLFLKITGSKIVLDKYPEMIFRVDYTEKIFSGCRFLFITRNFYDTVFSNQLWNNSNSLINKNIKEDWWGLNNKKWKLICEELLSNSELLQGYTEQIKKFDDDILKSAVEWIVTMEQGLNVLKSHKNILHVKYENIIEETEPTLNKILNFLNLNADNKINIYAKAILKKKTSKPIELVLPDFLINAASVVSTQLNYKFIK